jgi:hypothetical protein
LERTLRPFRSARKVQTWKPGINMPRLDLVGLCGYQALDWPPASRPARQAALAQLVEHIIRNDGVACSSHASGTKNSLKNSALAETSLRNLIWAALK